MTLVFAFDRDWTVDVNPHPNREAVPLEWVRHLAHETDHTVYAIGNQSLADEAAIPGVVDIVGRHSDEWEQWLGGKQPDGYYERFPTRRERLALIADLHPDADDYVVVDDIDLSDVDGWDHYHAWEFVPAVEQGDIDPGLPWAREPVTDGGYPTSAGLVAVNVPGLSSSLDEHDGPAFDPGRPADETVFTLGHTHSQHAQVAEHGTHRLTRSTALTDSLNSSDENTQERTYAPLRHHTPVRIRRRQHPVQNDSGSREGCRDE